MTYILKQFDTALLRFSATEDTSAPEIDILWVNDEKRSLLPLDLEVTPESLDNWLRHRTIPKNRAFVHAFLSKCGLNLNRPIKFRHRANLDISLQKRFWNLGIGTAMLEALMDVARDRGVMQLELDYIEGNARGRALYEKMGFTEVARHPDAVRFRDGRMRSLVFMMKKLLNP